MIVHLIRHAHAVTDKEDPKRPLSPRGRDECRRLADFFLRNRAFTPALVWHSPLDRAHETALLLLGGLCLDPALIETPGLLPDDEPEEIATRLDALPPTATVALVGHEPHLSALASLLVRGKPKPALFDLKKGAVLSLERTDSLHKNSGTPRWRVLWHVTPSLLPPSPASAAPTNA